MRFILSTFCLVFLLAVTTVAQIPANGKAWTLQECIAYALGNNLTVKRSVLNVESSEINLRQSKFGMLPTLSASSNYSVRWGRSIDPTSNDFVTQRYNSAGLNGSSNALLWNNFRIQHNIRSDKRDLEASTKDFEAARNTAALNVANFFLNALLNKEQVRNAESLLASSQQQLERTRIMVESGALARSELLNIQAQAATNELSLVQAQNSLDLAFLSLKQALQLPASTPFDIVEPEIDVESEMLDASTPEEIYAIAVELMPEIESVELREQSAAIGIKAANSGLFPSLSIGAGFGSNYSQVADAPRFVREGEVLQPVQIGYVQGTNDPVFQDRLVATGHFTDGYGFRDQISDNFNRSVQLSLSIPIFNGLSSRSNLQRAVISHEQAVIAETETKNQLRQQIETAYTSALAAAKTYQSALRQVEARDEAFRMISQRYELGDANFVEYQVSQNDLFQAQSNLTRAKYDFIFRKKVLDFYQGKALEL